MAKNISGWRIEAGPRAAAPYRVRSSERARPRLDQWKIEAAPATPIGPPTWREQVEQRARASGVAIGSEQEALGRRALLGGAVFGLGGESIGEEIGLTAEEKLAGEKPGPLRREAARIAGAGIAGALTPLPGVGTLARAGWTAAGAGAADVAGLVTDNPIIKLAAALGLPLLGLRALNRVADLKAPKVAEAPPAPTVGARGVFRVPPKEPIELSEEVSPPQFEPRAIPPEAVAMAAKPLDLSAKSMAYRDGYMHGRGHPALTPTSEAAWRESLADAGHEPKDIAQWVVGHKEGNKLFKGMAIPRTAETAPKPPAPIELTEEMVAPVEAKSPPIKPTLEGQAIRKEQADRASQWMKVESGADLIPDPDSVPNVPGMVYYAKPEALKIDPERFQYKLGTDLRTGAGRVMRKAKVWNEEAAGVITAWRDKIGDLYVVNGHHRLALYKQLAKEGKEIPPRLRVQVLNEGESFPGALANGIDESEAKVRGALQSIFEQHGTPVDAATIIREKGITPAQLEEIGMDLGDKTAEQAVAIARLDDFLFRELQLGRLDEGRAAMIGREVPERAGQIAAYKLMKKLEDEEGRVDPRRFEKVIRFTKGAETVGEQGGLFTPAQMQSSLAIEKAEIAEYLERKLRTEKRVFGGAVRQQGLLEAGGTAVDVARGKQISADAGTLMSALETFGYNPETKTSEVLNGLARELHGASKAKRAQILSGAYEGAIVALQEDLAAQNIQVGKLAETGVARPPEGGLFGRGGGEGTNLSGGLLPGIERIPAAIEAIGKSPQLQRARYELMAKFAPDKISEAARAFHGNMRTTLAEGAASAYVSREWIAPLHSYFQELAKSVPTKQILKDFYGSIQRGDAFPDYLKDLESWREPIRDAFDHRFNLINSLRDGWLRYRQNYLPNLFKDPKAVEAYIESVQPRTIRGTSGFFKRQEFSFEELIDKFESAFENPADTIFARLLDEDRFYMGQKLFQQGTDNGTIKLTQGDAPRHWDRINDRIAEVVQTDPETGTRKLTGVYYAQKDMARLMNNFFAPSPDQSILYRWVHTPMAQANALRVAVGGFHYLFETASAMAMEPGIDFADAFGALFEGRLRDAAIATGRLTKDVLTAPAKPYQYYKIGKAAQKSLLSGEPGDVARAVIEAGGRFTSERGLDSLAHSSEAIIRQMLPPSVPERMITAISKPLMKYYVPRIKIGAFYKVAERQLQEAANKGVEVDAGQYRRILQDSWEHVDNTLGQMVRDNLAFSPGMKGTLGLGINFPGWNIGSYRLLYNAHKAAAKLLTGQAGKVGTLEKLSLGQVAGTFMMGAVVNILTQYALTGKGPQGPLDLLAPQDGGTLPSGKPSRVIWPSYIWGWIKAHTSPVATIGNKLSIVMDVLRDFVSNKNFRGIEIYDPTRAWPVKAGQFVGYEAKQALTPFAVGAYQRATEKGPAGIAMSALGINPASAQIGQSADESLMQTYLARRYSNVRTAEQAERGDIKRKFLQSWRGGKRPEAVALMKDALTGRQVTFRQAEQWRREAVEHPDAVQFKRLTPEEAIEVYTVAGPENRRRYRSLLVGKVFGAGGEKLRKLRDSGQLQRLKDMLRQAPTVPASAPVS